MDVVVDEQLNPWLCEVNYNPEMTPYKDKIEIVEDMFKRTFTLLFCDY